jgi:hypothetical protein
MNKTEFENLTGNHNNLQDETISQNKITDHPLGEAFESLLNTMTVMSEERVKQLESLQLKLEKQRELFRSVFKDIRDDFQNSESPIA